MAYLWPINDDFHNNSSYCEKFRDIFLAEICIVEKRVRGKIWSFSMSAKHPSQEINKRVVWDTMLRLRVLTYINIENTCKNSGPNLENWARFWNHLEIEILPDLTPLHSSFRAKLCDFFAPCPCCFESTYVLIFFKVKHSVFSILLLALVYKHTEGD